MADQAYGGHEHDDKHTFLLAGEATIFGHHLAMFHIPNHQYELLLKIGLPQEVKQAYLEDLRRNPDSFHGVQIPETHATVLPPIGTGKVKEFTAHLFRLTPVDNGTRRKLTDITPAGADFKVKVDRVLRFRHLIREKINRPATLTYLVFGEGKEAHMAHQLAVPMDYDQLIRLGEVPPGISGADLATGVKVTIPGFADTSTPQKTFTTNPLTAGSYEAVREGGGAGKVTLTPGAQHWWNYTSLNPPLVKTSAGQSPRGVAADRAS